VIRAINVYAHGKDVFDEHAAVLGDLFAKPAAVAVHNAQILTHALAVTAQLQAALSVRPVIDQAIGRTRSRNCGRSAKPSTANWLRWPNTSLMKPCAPAPDTTDLSPKRQVDLRPNCRWTV
jgi:hypothetical protein